LHLSPVTFSPLACVVWHYSGFMICYRLQSNLTKPRLGWASWTWWGSDAANVGPRHNRACRFEWERFIFASWLISSAIGRCGPNQCVMLHFFFLEMQCWCARETNSGLDFTSTVPLAVVYCVWGITSLLVPEIVTGTKFCDQCKSPDPYMTVCAQGFNLPGYEAFLVLVY
jgi:hypothetical protein